jgi:predicted transcriptional regulator of viral defense system
VEWQDKGYLVRIVNRWYMLADAQRSLGLDCLIANRIYAPSYVSLQSAWAYYGLIPEGVYQITSVSTLKTHTFRTTTGVFSYRHVKPAMLFGYHLIDAGGHSFKIAEPEKLVIDHLYLNTKLKSPDDFEGLRINQPRLHELVSPDRLSDYLTIVKNKALEKRINVFLKTYSL